MTSMAIKLLQSRLERRAPRDQECVPGMVVALTVKRAGERAQERRHG